MFGKKKPRVKDEVKGMSKKEKKERRLYGSDDFMMPARGKGKPVKERCGHCGGSGRIGGGKPCRNPMCKGGMITRYR